VADDVDDHGHHNWQDRRNGKAMQVWQKPIVRQYFHKGLLWRAQEAQEVASYELFIDLFYVAIIAISGDTAAEDPTGQALVHFAFTFIIVWKFWTDLTQGISWFDEDDMIRRFEVLFMLTCLLGMTINITGGWDSTYTALIAFYIASRWFSSLLFLWMAWLIPMVRSAMIGSAIVTFLPGVLWIGSIHVPQPARQALIWTAIPLDIFGPTILVMVQRGMIPFITDQGVDWFKRTFEFIPGSNIEHKIERTNAFVSLVFGYSVVSLLYQSAAPVGLNAFFGKAVLGLIQAFAFNWLYFEVDTFNMHVHAIRRHFVSAFFWLTTHLPFVMAFVLAGSALAKIVLATDCADANVRDLQIVYAHKSADDVPMGLRWYYCGGLAIALFCMGVISLSHSYKTVADVRLGKPYRIALRFAASLAILLLPLAKERLNSLQLVATTTGITLVVLLVELVGSACMQVMILGFNWKVQGEKRKCTYSARCHVSNKELEAKFKNGEVVKVEEVAKRGRHGKRGEHEGCNVV
jgi:low temperature requirement protein LtrA